MDGCNAFNLGGNIVGPFIAFELLEMMRWKTWLEFVHAMIVSCSRRRDFVGDGIYS
jgi:hypothetical protein